MGKNEKVKIQLFLFLSFCSEKIVNLYSLSDSESDSDLESGSDFDSDPESGLELESGSDFDSDPESGSGLESDSKFDFVLAGSKVDYHHCLPLPDSHPTVSIIFVFHHS